MPWPCYLVTKVTLAEPKPVYADNDSITTRFAFRLADGSEVLFRELKVGAVWIDPDRGICVKLPSNSTGTIWAIQEPSTGGGPGWTWTGEPPNITATPSINCVGSYHGWVQNGSITEDCEGRKFDDYGKLLDGGA